MIHNSQFNTGMAGLGIREEEKQRISQEIHDTLSQSLAVLKMNLQHAIHEGELPKSGAAMVTQVNHIIDLTRYLAYDLRPPLLEEMGLINAIRRHVEIISHQFRIKIQVLISQNVVEFNKADSLQLFRIVQESVANAVKHSKASDVAVEITHQYSTDIFTIRDNGIGFDSKKMRTAKQNNHFGLQILQERCDAIGARCEIKSTPGQGTSVIIQYKHSKEEVV